MSETFGIAAGTAAALRRLFDTAPGLGAVWVYGSRAQGTARPESDIDLAIDAPDWTPADYARLTAQIEALQPLYGIDTVWLQSSIDATFRARIERDRKLFWEPRRHRVDAGVVGSVQLKPFQEQVLRQVHAWLDELARQRGESERVASLDIGEDIARDIADFPKRAWARLKLADALPPLFAANDYSSRFDGAGRPIPNACLKIPTGGGKTLLAAAAVARVHTAYLRRHTGLVLWVVPNEAIYRQTLRALSDRDHPYRQMLNVAGAGRVKVLEKTSPLSRLDVESHLCVMLLMLQSAARQSRETLKVFRDRGNVLGFVPREDDYDGHWALLQSVPNLDVYAPFGASDELARKQKGSIVKSSLGNVLRMLRPMIVMDEGHHAYTENALRTLDGFNPSLLLELSATPRVASARSSGSNILVDVRGTDLDEAQMIKLPIHVEVRRWNDWQSCLAASVQQLEALQRDAARLQGDTARYIRPILLVQVERTGADMHDSGFIHADDARAYLLQLGFSERQIAIKTSEKDELKQPENIDLMSPTCEIRAIITKQALQEGWDCPFAYVLCALAAGRSLGAMTQLLGRILRQPDVARTGVASLDACYVYCHDAKTAEVVDAIRNGLQGEGMGDLTLKVRSDDADALHKTRTLSRRPGFRGLRLFLPRVTWNEGAHRRELVYESDVLARLPWNEVDPTALARSWAPGSAETGSHLTLTLEILAGTDAVPDMAQVDDARRLDRAGIVRALIDLAPNGWLVWQWVDAAVARLRAQGVSEEALAGASESLIERLRVDIEAERDRLAQSTFEQLVQQGRIEFSLRADATDYELPHEWEIVTDGAPRLLIRDDGRPADKSLLEPPWRLSDMNAFEEQFAVYLDGKSALRWWHRNVARTQYGLQGWRRHKVYPDFVFALAGNETPGRTRIVVMETKGGHLAGSQDTEYKRMLLERLSAAYRNDTAAHAGELVLEDASGTRVECDLLVDEAWRGTLDRRYFAD